MARYNRKRVPKDELERVYNELLSQPKVAEHFGVSERSIRRWMSRYEIDARDMKGEGNPNYKHGKGVGRYDYKQKTAHIEKCDNCGGDNNLGVHHIDYDHYNNDPDNLQVLCVSCHITLHKKAYWKAKKAGKEPKKSNGPIGWDRK